MGKNNYVTSDMVSSSLLLDYESIKERTEYQKELFIDRLFSELICSNSKLKKVMAKYKKAKVIAKKNFGKYKECNQKLKQALEYIDMNGRPVVH